AADPGKCSVDGALDFCECEAERFDRALQPLEQVHGHQLLETLLTPSLAKVGAGAACRNVVEVLVLAEPAREHVRKWRVDGKSQELQLLEDVVEGRHILEIRQRLAD